MLLMYNPQMEFYQYFYFFLTLHVRLYTQHEVTVIGDVVGAQKDCAI